MHQAPMHVDHRGRAAWMPFVLLTLLAVVGGCTSPAPTPSAPTTSGLLASTFPWGISGCDFAIVEVEADAGGIAAHLPSGFSAKPGAGLVPGTTGPTLSLDAYRCDVGVGLAGDLRDVSYGSYYVPVEPPSELREPGFEAYFVKWNPLIQDDARRTSWATHGLPAHSGEASVVVPDDGAPGPVTATLTMSGAGGFRFTGVVDAATRQTSPLPFMEFTPLEGGKGLARWHARLHDALIGGGAGTLEVLPGSWVADVVGSGPVHANVIAGRWNLDEADVTMPVPWPR